jgi:hypothetical protein
MATPQRRHAFAEHADAPAALQARLDLIPREIGKPGSADRTAGTKAASLRPFRWRR